MLHRCYAALWVATIAAAIAAATTAAGGGGVGGDEAVRLEMRKEQRAYGHSSDEMKA